MARTAAFHLTLCAWHSTEPSRHEINPADQWCSHLPVSQRNTLKVSKVKAHAQHHTAGEPGCRDGVTWTHAKSSLLDSQAVPDDGLLMDSLEFTKSSTVKAKKVFCTHLTFKLKCSNESSKSQGRVWPNLHGGLLLHAHSPLIIEGKKLNFSWRFVFLYLNYPLPNKMQNAWKILTGKLLYNILNSRIHFWKLQKFVNCKSDHKSITLSHR